MWSRRSRRRLSWWVWASGLVDNNSGRVVEVLTADCCWPPAASVHRRDRNHYRTFFPNSKQVVFNHTRAPNGFSMKKDQSNIYEHTHTHTNPNHESCSVAFWSRDAKVVLNMKVDTNSPEVQGNGGAARVTTLMTNRVLCICKWNERSNWAHPQVGNGSQSQLHSWTKSSQDSTRMSGGRYHLLQPKVRSGEHTSVGLLTPGCAHRPVCSNHCESWWWGGGPSQHASYCAARSSASPSRSGGSAQGPSSRWGSTSQRPLHRFKKKKWSEMLIIEEI